jgi:hypothetical protein
MFNGLAAYGSKISMLKTGQMDLRGMRSSMLLLERISWLESSLVRIKICDQTTAIPAMERLNVSGEPAKVLALTNSNNLGLPAPLLFLRLRSSLDIRMRKARPLQIGASYPLS